ncbi:Oxidoreductase [Diaporthe australafricana]|uniref:Mitochondrial intermembrane space import and assembly protein 40 n=1 Tax=Diaporthe australafricana TaxID=127596 RepID=A0ABR3X0Y9_9PEZI
MFRAAVRSAPRALRQPSTIASAGRRFASTAPADKRYTWKGTATRWGLAIGALYIYNTSPMFADELPSRLSDEPPQFAESDLQTVDAIVDEKRKQLDAKLKARESQTTKEAVAADSATPQQTQSTAVASPEDAEKSPEQLEEEAGQQGAFNPETGEINFDCPCLGGMAHGPCGEEFKAAFSCFVYSDQEPKGIECIDKFQHMQDCFRKYPDVYGAEIADEEAAGQEAEQLALDMPTPDSGAPKTERVMAATPGHTEEKPAAPASKAEPSHDEVLKVTPADAPKGSPSPDNAAGQDDKGDADAAVGPISEERGVPEKAFDATGANKTQ